MRPVHEFKANFSQTEPATDARPDNVADALTLHEADSSVRNLCLVWEDGRKSFFNYAYLVAGEFEPNSERHRIKLSFSSHTVTLYGYNLKSLFMALLDHTPRIIEITHPRYRLEKDKRQCVLVEIVLERIDG